MLKAKIVFHIDGSITKNVVPKNNIRPQSLKLASWQCEKLYKWCSRGIDDRDTVIPHIIVARL